MSKQEKLTKQMVQDIGEYHVCFALSQMGLRAVRTSQNAKGVDILAYGEKTFRPVTIQVKAARQPVTDKVCSRKHEQAEDDIRMHPIARFWVLVQLQPGNSGQIKCVHVWDSNNKDHLNLLRPRNPKSGPKWCIAASVGNQQDREKWDCLKDGWKQIADFLNAKSDPESAP